MGLGILDPKQGNPDTEGSMSERFIVHVIGEPSHEAPQNEKELLRLREAQLPTFCFGRTEARAETKKWVWQGIH